MQRKKINGGYISAIWYNLEKGCSMLVCLYGYEIGIHIDDEENIVDAQGCDKSWISIRYNICGYTM